MSDVKERPIILTAQEVNAVLAGDKTQYRVLSLTDEQVADGYQHCYGVASGQVVFTKDESDKSFVEDGYINVECALGSIGDRLWVQEPTHTANSWDWFYDATHSLVECKDPYTPSDLYLPWDDDHQEYTGPIGAEHMPYWASRLLLEITDIRVERVHDITHNDAVAEYCFNFGEKKKQCIPPLSGFAEYWREKHGDDSWRSNPWVWVIEFKVIKES